MKKIDTYIIEKFKISKNISSSKVDDVREEIFKICGLNISDKTNTEEAKEAISNWVEKNEIEDFDAIIFDIQTLKNIISLDNFKKNFTYTKNAVDAWTEYLHERRAKCIIDPDLCYMYLDEIFRKKETNLLCKIKKGWDYYVVESKENPNVLLVGSGTYDKSFFQYYTIIIKNLNED